jgi:predicted phosphodiesterase
VSRRVSRSVACILLSLFLVVGARAAPPPPVETPLLLAGFEQDAELGRVLVLTNAFHPTEVKAVKAHATEGKRSLEVTVTTEGAVLYLRHRPTNWTGVYALSLDLYSQAPVPIGLDGYLLQRLPGPAESSRALPFRRILQPGQTRVIVRHLEASPLDLATLQPVTVLVLPGLAKTYHVYLDNVRLLPQPTAATAIIKGPYLQNLSPTAVTLMWETDGPGDSSVSVTAESQWKYAGERGAVHEVRLSDLSPGTSYSYVVRSEEVTSERFTFHTPPESAHSLRFVAYGDTRTQPLEHWRVARAIAQTKPQFVLHTGDLVGAGKVYDNWEGDFFQPAADLLAGTCLFPVLGNHESEAHWYYDFFAPPGEVKSWYDFRWGPAYFLALDSEKPFDPASEQYAWLQQRLASEACREARWRFALWHQPAYSSGPHGGSEALRKHVVPLLVEAKFDMVFAGHDHCYERSYADGLYHITAGGGGAPLYEQEAVDQEGKSRNPASQVFVTAYHFCLVEVEGDVLTLSALTPDGKVLDRLTIKKGAASGTADESSVTQEATLRAASH